MHVGSVFTLSVRGKNGQVASLPYDAFITLSRRILDPVLGRNSFASLGVTPRGRETNRQARHACDESAASSGARPAARLKRTDLPETSRIPSSSPP